MAIWRRGLITTSLKSSHNVIGNPFFSTLRKHDLQNCVFSLLSALNLPCVYFAFRSVNWFIHSFIRWIVHSLLRFYGHCTVFTVFAFCIVRCIYPIYLLFWIHNSGKHPNLNTYTITEWHYHSFDTQIKHTLMHKMNIAAVGRAEKKRIGRR